MSLMQAPVGIIILRKSMAREELERKGPPGHLTLPHRRWTATMVARAAIGRVLIALGTRLDPAAGVPAPAASGLRA